MKKLTKYIVCLAAVLVVAASTMGCTEDPPPTPGPSPPPDPSPTPMVDKATGGGWFYDNVSGNKCTFGFNAQYKDNPGAVENEKIYTGQIQFKDHGTGVKFHLKEMTFVSGSAEYANFGGFDKDENYVEVLVVDAGEPGWGEGDGIAIWYASSDEEEEPTWSGYLEGGNIQTHP